MGLWAVIAVDLLSTQRGLLELSTYSDSLDYFHKNSVESLTTAAFVGWTVLPLYKIIELWQTFGFPQIVSLRLMRGNTGSSTNTSGLD